MPTTVPRNPCWMLTMHDRSGFGSHPGGLTAVVPGDADLGESLMHGRESLGLFDQSNRIPTSDRFRLDTYHLLAYGHRLLHGGNRDDESDEMITARRRRKSVERQHNENLASILIPDRIDCSTPSVRTSLGFRPGQPSFPSRFARIALD